MKQPIRAFSIGLFTSGIILLLIFLIFGEANNKQKELSTEEMTEALEDDGYHVLTDSEYVSLSVQTDQENEQEDKDSNGNDDSKEDSGKNNDNTNENKDDNEKEEEEKEKEEESSTYTLTIDEGVASSDIGAQLEDNNIIDDAGKFNRFLEEEGYELKVQIGSFDVSSDMNFDEIANVITK